MNIDWHSFIAGLITGLGIQLGVVIFLIRRLHHGGPIDTK